MISIAWKWGPMAGVLIIGFLLVVAYGGDEVLDTQQPPDTSGGAAGEAGKPPVQVAPQTPYLWRPLQGAPPTQVIPFDPSAPRTTSC